MGTAVVLLESTDTTKVKSKCLNYTRNEWRRCKTTLEKSGKDVTIHSKREWNITYSLHPEWQLITRIILRHLIFSTRFECSLTSFPLVSSVVSRRSIVWSKSQNNSARLYTLNWSKRSKKATVLLLEVPETTLGTSGEDVKIHPEWVGKM